MLEGSRIVPQATLGCIQTAVQDWLTATLHCAFHHVAHVGAHDWLHHLAGAFKLLEELVHLREGCAGAVCNSLAAASVDAVRMLALVWGH